MTKPALVITNRDVRILAWVYSTRGTTTDHIRKRFFPTAGARSACYGRLARLVDAGYLASVRLPSFSGYGSGKAFVTPGSKARPLLAEVFGRSRTELGQLRMVSPLFIHHHLASLDVRLAIELAAERWPIFTLQEWRGDHELRHTPIRVSDPATNKAICFVPDACFSLTLAGGGEQAFHLEIDLATLSPNRCREKFCAYLLQPAKQMLPVLFVTTDQLRCDALARYAQQAAEDVKADPTVFWLTVKDRISEKSVLAQPIWRIVGGPESSSLASAAGIAPEEFAVANHERGHRRSRLSFAPSGSLLFKGGSRD